ncbi:MAG TPA: TetR/AcrR family transcriptional regulator [Sphingopyxis sp.]|nr:TetR/AcrR family transcriptional regulator [Sphingopyxis sp.]
MRQFDIDEALDRATREFWAKGYAGTTLDDLTQAMGIKRPSLYRVFGNKEALFVRVVEHFESTYLAFVGDALASETPDLIVRRLLEGTVRACFGTGTPRGSLLAHGAPAGSPEDEGVRILLAERIEVYERKLAASLARFQAGGTAPPGGDGDAASFLITHCCGIALRAKAGASHDKLLAETDFVMAAFGFGTIEEPRQDNCV